MKSVIKDNMLLAKERLLLYLAFFPLFDSNSWDEHVFELVLPKACMVGHVDFKFVLNSNITNIPQIQVTLLKNKAPGLGKVNGENESKFIFEDFAIDFFKKLIFQLDRLGFMSLPCLPPPLHFILHPYTSLLCFW